MAIESVDIATNRYAPSGADAISLYNSDTASGLTLGQLVISVCLRSAGAYEAQSVVKMNTMTDSSVRLEEASGWMEKIAAGSADWNAAKLYLTGTLGIDASSLPDGIDTYAKRMQAVSAAKGKIDVLVQQQQRDMIDLQTLVNRRDVAYSTSSNVVNAIGVSMTGNSNNI